MSGHLTIVGLGPGDPRLVAPLAVEAITAATDLVGYGPYLDRAPARPDQNRHASDNREEIARARAALALAAQGRRVAVISSGDPGVFAMASAVFEAMETGEAAWQEVQVTVVPGISAMLAAAARVGAPLGHDFCVLSLSDNLKPWDLVLTRLEAALRADFVLALYNVASKARPWQLGEALRLVAKHRPAQTPIVYARSVTQATENIEFTTVGAPDQPRADMRTLILIGSSATRLVHRPQGQPYIYTPRQAEVVA
jgi:precorrin-3B C17-methyltransferase